MGYLVSGNDAGADQASINADIGTLNNMSGQSGAQTAVQNATDNAASIAGTGAFNDQGIGTANSSLADLANQYQQTLDQDAGGKSAGGILQDQLISGGGNRSALAQAIQQQAQATSVSQGAAASGKLSANAQAIMNQLHANLLQTQSKNTQQGAQFAAQNAGDQLKNQAGANQNAINSAAGQGQNQLHGINTQNNNAQWQQAGQIAQGAAGALSSGLSAYAGMGQSGVSPTSSGEMSLGSPGQLSADSLQGDSTLNPSGFSAQQVQQMQQPLSLGDAGAGKSYSGFQIQPLQLTSY